MPVAHANGLDIRYEVQGSGPWLVLSHSLACDLARWDKQAEALSRYLTVLRYDTRGHGGSSVPPGPYAFEDAVADLVGLLDVLNIERAHFAGLSMGGMIGQHFALMHPGRLDRLVLASTHCRSQPAAREAVAQRIAMAERGGMAALVEPTLARWFTEPWRYSHPEVMAKVGALIAATPVAGYAACSRMVAGMDTLERLPQIRANTLVLVGDEDAGTTPEMAAVIAGAIPGARLEVLPQASHLLNIEQAQMFGMLVVEFLNQ